MKPTWFVKFDPKVGLSIEDPEIAKPAGRPQFGPTQFGCQAASWIDEIFDLFLPVIEADSRIQLYVEVGNDQDDWGIMHAWIIPQSTG
jgi:hypothetical protein